MAVLTDNATAGQTQSHLLEAGGHRAAAGMAVKHLGSQASTGQDVIESMAQTGQDTLRSGVFQPMEMLNHKDIQLRLGMARRSIHQSHLPQVLRRQQPLKLPTQPPKPIQDLHLRQAIELITAGFRVTPAPLGDTPASSHK
jgi:hypothetical protein